MKRVCVWVVLVVVGCGPGSTQDPGDNQDEPPSWAGTYALFADSSSNCQEVQDPSGRQCVCGSSGHYEGTLSLVADDTGGVAGELLVQECRPDVDPACGASVSYAVQSFASPPPPPGVEIPAAWLRFCANGCPFGANGAWTFTVPSEGSTLVGRYTRADGSARGCGNDHGPFTAVRQ